MCNNKDFWKDFSNTILELPEIANEKPEIERETFHNIDLLIKTSNSVIVIENKIKSGINGLHAKRKGYSQLEKYYKAVKKEFKDKKRYYFVLRPNYNNEDYESFDFGCKYKEIKYSEILEIINHLNTPTDIDNFYLMELKSVCQRHSREYDNELLKIVDKRFKLQIKQFLNI